MKLAISNFLRLRGVELELSGVTLVAGHNEAGKSSACLALGAALAMQPMPILNAAGKPAIAKKDAHLLVHDGAGMAVVALEHDQGSVTIAWPGCTVATTGQPLACSIFAAGLAKLSRLRPEERARAVQDALGADPTIEDLRNALPEDLRDHVALAWASIERDGWDGAHTAAQRKGAELKGRWQEVTGEPYGSAKAETWEPKGRLENEHGALTMEASENDLRAAEAEVEALCGAKVASSMAAGKSREMAGKVDVARSDLAAAEASLAAAEAELASALEAKAAAPAIWGDSGAPCPACGAQIRPTRGDHGEMLLERVELAGNPADHAKATDERKAVDARAEAAQKAASHARAVHLRAQQFAEACERAAEAPQISVNEEALAAAKDKADRIETHIKAMKAHRRAREIAGKITQNAAFVEALSPGGVRASVMGAALGRLNDEVRRFVDACGEDGVGAPELLADMSIVRDARPYEMLSESARFRVDVALQVAMARLAGDPMVVIDRADVLDADGRNALFGGMNEIKMPALVAMTMSAKRLMPDLAALGGRSYWLDG